MNDRNLRVVVHGGDFTVLGYEEDLDLFRSRINEEYEVKFRGRIGPAPGDDKSIRILKSVVEWGKMECGMKRIKGTQRSSLIGSDL